MNRITTPQIEEGATYSVDKQCYLFVLHLISPSEDEDEDEDDDNSVEEITHRLVTASSEKAAWSAINQIMVNKDFEELDDNDGVAQRKWTNDWDDICIDMVTTDDPIFVMQMTECIYSDHDILIEWAKVNVKLAAKVLRNMVQRQGIAVYASRNYQEVMSIVEACELDLETPQAKHRSYALAI